MPVRLSTAPTVIISLSLSLPELNAIAFGGVDTGSTNASEQVSVTARRIGGNMAVVNEKLGRDSWENWGVTYMGKLRPVN